METKAQVTKIFSYLRDIKKLDQKIIRNVNEYENTGWPIFSMPMDVISMMKIIMQMIG